MQNVSLGYVEMPSNTGQYKSLYLSTMQRSSLEYVAIPFNTGLYKKCTFYQYCRKCTMQGISLESVARPCQSGQNRACFLNNAKRTSTRARQHRTEEYKKKKYILSIMQTVPQKHIAWFVKQEIQEEQKLKQLIFASALLDLPCKSLACFTQLWPWVKV